MTDDLTRNLDHQPDSDEILYRGFGDAASSYVSLCKHLRAEVDGHLEEAIAIGVMVSLQGGSCGRRRSKASCLWT